jgi:hypothetical protein
MKSKIITAIGAGSLIAGMVALSGCFDAGYPAYGYGYSGAPVYYTEPAPVIVRDYDGHRDWRDRDDHDNDHRVVVTRDSDHDREVHASADHDHNRDVH